MTTKSPYSSFEVDVLYVSFRLFFFFKESFRNVLNNTFFVILKFFFFMNKYQSLSNVLIFARVHYPGTGEHDTRNYNNNIYGLPFDHVVISFQNNKPNYQ